MQVLDIEYDSSFFDTDPYEPIGPNAHRSPGDRLVRVGVEERAVVLDVQDLHPLRMSLRERGAKAGGAELVDVAVDPLCLSHELLPVEEELPVVPEPVDADLEPASSELVHQAAVEAITLRDEVEGRAKPKSGLQVGHRGHEALAVAGLDIVRQDEGVASAVRPEVDERKARSVHVPEAISHDLELEAHIEPLARP